MQIVLDTADNTVINWSAHGVDRIVQNVVNLLHTKKYEVAYDRTLGLPGEFIDKPVDQAVAIATAEIFDLISIKEPRAKLTEVQYVGQDLDGNMQFRVVIEV